VEGATSAARPAAEAPEGGGALDRKLVRGSAWLALSYGGGQIVSLVSTAVLAHLLTPGEFGLVALASIAVVALSMLQESGLGLAVIRRRSELEEAAGSAFAFTLAMGATLYGLAVACSPLAAWLFHQPRLTAVMPVLMLLLPLRALAAIPGALIEREIAFARRARGELTGVAAQALTAIPLAALGFGVWSLVLGQLANQAMQTGIFWLLAPFHPSLRRARWQTLRELGRFGRPVTIGNFVSLVDGNIDTIVAGRIVGADGVGFYALAWRLCNLPATGLAYILGRVMFPAYAALQESKAEFREAFLTNLRRVALVSLPTGLLILVAAKPIVVGVFGAPWEPAVAPLRILAVFGIIRSFAGPTGPVFQAAGRPQLVYQISLWHLGVLSVGLLSLTRPFGIQGIAAAMTIAAFSSLLPSYWFALRVLELRPEQLAAELARPAVCSLPLAAALLAVLGLGGDLAAGVLLPVALAVAGAVYAGTVAVVGRAEVRLIRAAFRS
jgi:O-antigen/teichoic acid export membrane protein